MIKIGKCFANQAGLREAIRITANNYTISKQKLGNIVKYWYLQSQKILKRNCSRLHQNGLRSQSILDSKCCRTHELIYMIYIKLIYIYQNFVCSKCNISPEKKKHLRAGERVRITMIGSSSHWFKINNYQVQCQETNKRNLLKT